MTDDIQHVILGELREFRADTQKRLSSLEDSRAENRGVLKVFMASGIISAAVAWVTGNYHH